MRNIRSKEYGDSLALSVWGIKSKESEDSWVLSSGIKKSKNQNERIWKFLGPVHVEYGIEDNWSKDVLMLSLGIPAIQMVIQA